MLKNRAEGSGMALPAEQGQVIAAEHTQETPSAESRIPLHGGALERVSTRRPVKDSADGNLSHIQMNMAERTRGLLIASPCLALERDLQEHALS
jgi:hypothetical protein